MLDYFYEGLVKAAADKKEEKRPSRGHSVGMLGALGAGGYGAYAAKGRLLGIPGTSTAHKLMNAALYAPLGYLAARGTYGVISKAKKHGKRALSAD